MAKQILFEIEMFLRSLLRLDHDTVVKDLSVIQEHAEYLIDEIEPLADKEITDA